MSKVDFLLLAHQTGVRIANTAIWSGAECTWEVVTPDRRDPTSRTPQTDRADGLLYQGTAGIGLFLAELWDLTNDSTLLATVHGAAARAKDMTVALEPGNLSFHSGRMGIAYFFARLAQILDDQRYADWARATLAPIAGQEGNDWGLDVIAGAAGAIPALLQISARIEVPGAFESAVAMGELLLKEARQGPTGWSWGVSPKGCHRGGLTGLAHGAAGYGYGLLELYGVTGDTRFRYAAEQAFAYEAPLLQAHEGNWLDLRNQDLMQLVLQPDGAQQLRERLRSGEQLPPYEYRCMTAWCHGAPGIGLTRLRAFELLGDSCFAEQAMVAVRTTANSLREQHNSSLCHGLAGNCETLVMASRVFQAPSWLTLARHVAAEKIRAWDRDPDGWPSGTTNALADPSLMLGDSGMGYTLLRLHSVDVPSVVFLTAPQAQPRRADANVEISSELRDEYVDQYFARAIRVFERLNPNSPSLRIQNGARHEHSEIALVFDETHRRVETEINPLHRALMIDAMTPERVRYEAALAFNDFTIETLNRLRRLTVDEVDWEVAEFTHATHLAIVDSVYDWDAWIKDGSDQLPAPADAAVSFVVFRGQQAVHCQRIAPFGAAILEAMSDGATIAEITNEIMGAADAEMRDADQWYERVKFQMESMYRAGFVDVVGNVGGMLE